MAISSVSAAIAGARPQVPWSKAATPALVAGRPHSLWYLAGDPGPGSMDNSTAGGVVLSSSSSVPAGSLYRTDPGSGESRLGRFTGRATIAGTIQLCDRIWHGSSIVSGVLSVTSTSAQTIASFPGLPSRDALGATDGVGVRCGVEVYSALGAGTPTWTLTYTNSGGTTGKTATNIDSVVASSAIGAFYRFGLAAGDLGVRAPTSFQSSATATSGNFGLVLYRVLAELPVTQPFVDNELDILTGLAPKLHNGTVPFLLFIPSTTTASSVGGIYGETQG